MKHTNRLRDFDLLLCRRQCAARVEIDVFEAASAAASEWLHGPRGRLNDYVPSAAVVGPRSAERGVASAIFLFQWIVCSIFGNH